MTVLKLLVLLGFGVVVFNFVASSLGWRFPLLSRLVTVILGLFVAYELFVLGRVLLERFA
ncbi:MAG: hypothetical protein HC890_10245 [Chloroflexaceae bacterium]|nr:hypothetical protein [Chloroflexaceae bacterium]